MSGTESSTDGNRDPTRHQHRGTVKDFDQLLEEIKQKRDELALKIHLGSKDAQAQWSALETTWETFAAEARLHQRASDITAAAASLGSELKAGYEGIKKALR